MARGNEIGVAYYSLVPSMDGTAAAVNSQLGLVTSAGSVAGRQGGAALGAGLIGGLKAAGIVGAALGIAGLAGNVSDYFRDSVGLASDLAESANALSVTYGEQAGAISALGESAATSLGLSSLAFNQIATQFSAFAGTIAGEGGDVVGVIDELTTRGADFASVYNLEVNEALRLFQSGLAGETEPLRRFGLDLSAASVEAFALANGIGDGTSQLTEAQKVQARYGLLLEQTAKTQGDFANTSDSLANSQRIANAQFEDAQARIGQALLPAFEKFTAFLLEDGVPMINRLVDAFIKAEPVISDVADVTLALLDVFLTGIDTVFIFSDALDDGRISAQEAAAAIARLPKPIRDFGISVSTFLRDALFGIVNFVSGGLNVFIGVLNRFIGLLRPVVATFNALFGTKLTLPTIPSFGTVGPGTSAGFSGNPSGQTSGGNLFLAEGAVVTARPGGVQAVIGEGRYDEAVIPLSPSVLSQLGAAIGGGDRPIYMDGSIVGVLREVASREAELVLNGAVTGLGFDVRAGGVV